MKTLLIVAGLLAVFSNPSFAKEKETYVGQDGKLHCLHTDGMIHGDGACACMPDSPGSCANAVGAGDSGSALPAKADAKSAYIHRPDSTQYHPEGEGGIKTKPAVAGQAYIHRPDSTQYHPEGEGGIKTKPAVAGQAYIHRPDSTQYHPEGEGGIKTKPAVAGQAYIHRPDSTQYHPEGEGGIKTKATLKSDMPPRGVDKPQASEQ